MHTAIMRFAFASRLRRMCDQGGWFFRVIPWLISGLVWRWGLLPRFHLS